MTPETRALLADLAEFENQRGISWALSKIVNRAAAILAAEKPIRKTVRVRVAVAVTPDGQWNASGRSGGDDDETMDDARSFFGGATQLECRGVSGAFLTADVPLPDVPEITADVEVVR